MTNELELKAGVDRLFEILRSEELLLQVCCCDEVIDLLQRYPEAAQWSLPSQTKEAYRGRPFPLHEACRNNAPISVIRALLTAWPVAAQAGASSSDDSPLPLHDACRCGKSLETIQLLVETYPDSLAVTRLVRHESPDYDPRSVRLLPLHEALSNADVSLEIIQFLVQQRPEAMWWRMLDGGIALHWACYNGASLPIIKYLVEQWPDSIISKLGDPDVYRGRFVECATPFDLACASGASQEVLQYLFEQSRRNENCVHYACASSRAPFSTIAFLLDLLPGILYYSLQYACSFRTPDAETIALLIQKCPDAVQHYEYRTGSPLHLACASQASLEVIQMLVEAWPDAISKKEDEHGYLPLHYACEQRRDVTGVRTLAKIQFLVNAWPKSVEVSTKRDMYPLHMACSDPIASTDIIEFLIASYPAAITFTDWRNRLPLHVACAQGGIAPLETIQCLVRAHPASIHRVAYDDGYRNNGGSRPLPLDLYCARNMNLASPHVIRLLVDEDGTPPLHFACFNHHRTSWMLTRLNTITVLLSFFPNDRMQFHNGRLPFHYACLSGAPRIVLERLLWAYPNAIRIVTTDTGDLPLHLYLSMSKTVRPTCTSFYHHDMTDQQEYASYVATIEYLVEECHEVLRIPNRWGWLPLHMAAIHDVPLDVLFYLLLKNPEVVHHGR